MTPSTAVQAMIALKAVEVTTAFSEAPGTIRSMGAVETTPSPHPKPIKHLSSLNGSRSTIRFARWTMGAKGVYRLSNTVPGYGRHAPIVIQSGMLGNKAALIVSPAHRMMLRDTQAEVMFGQAEVLATAKSLCDEKTVYRMPVVHITYDHVVLSRHEIIFAEGCATESDQTDGTHSQPSADHNKSATDFLQSPMACIRPSLRHFEVQLLRSLQRSWTCPRHDLQAA
ncbi:Hint domain-containing protein [Ascidiaceihabitans sp.]|uniref:Hint domain-containing protein n=1 Tax=Ascidiaceihabitans sp. TaxID=1872644 RepID=UPI00329699F0